MANNNVKNTTTKEKEMINIMNGVENQKQIIKVYDLDIETDDDEKGWSAVATLESDNNGKGLQWNFANLYLINNACEIWKSLEGLVVNENQSLESAIDLFDYLCEDYEYLLLNAEEYMLDIEISEAINMFEMDESINENCLLCWMKELINHKKDLNKRFREYNS